MEEKIARLVFSGPRLPQSNAIFHVKKLARAIIECNEAFVQSKLVLSIDVLSHQSTQANLNECVRLSHHALYRAA